MKTRTLIIILSTALVLVSCEIERSATNVIEEWECESTKFRLLTVSRIPLRSSARIEVQKTHLQRWASVFEKRIEVDPTVIAISSMGTAAKCCIYFANPIEPGTLVAIRVEDSTVVNSAGCSQRVQEQLIRTFGKTSRELSQFVKSAKMDAEVLE